MARTPLTDDAIRTALATMPGWVGDRAGIRRTFRFDRYEAGVGFATEVFLLAQRLDHHPDVLVGWCRVEVSFVTHDAGGVTARDLDAARAVDALRP